MKIKRILPYITGFLTSATTVFAQRVNMTNLTNSNSLIDDYKFFIDQTDGMGGPLILFSTFWVAFVTLKIYGSKQAFSAASFLIMLLSMFLWAIGWLSSFFVYLSIILCVLGVIMLIYSSET